MRNGKCSVNPNMPLRGLIYISMLYQGYVSRNRLDIYSSTLLKLPAPRYIGNSSGRSSSCPA